MLSAPVGRVGCVSDDAIIAVAQPSADVRPAYLELYLVCTWSLEKLDQVVPLITRGASASRRRQPSRSTGSGTTVIFAREIPYTEYATFAE